MKIYIVLESSGEYEDERTWVSSVWDKEELAYSEAKRIRDTIYEIKSTPPPYDEDDYINGRLTERKEKKYKKWSDMVFDACEFNNAWVEEYELNPPGVLIKEPTTRNTD
jgi:hypothetical protein